MTLFYVWLARQCRHLAQWFDPLPDAVSGLHAVIENLRGDLARSIDDMAHADNLHFSEMDGLRQKMERAADAFVLLQQQHQHCIPVDHDELYESACALTAHWNDKDAPSGEYKRHNVLAGLKDAHPGRSERDMSLAIEAALWR